MKLRTRLYITFATMVVLPVLLTLVAFLGIGSYMGYCIRSEYGFKRVDYAAFSNSIQTGAEKTEALFQEILETANTSPEKFQDLSFLDELNKKAQANASYLIVRKGASLYYTRNNIATERIFHLLPEYGYAFSSPSDTGYYYSGMQKLVKQADCCLDDGSQLSIFIVTPLQNLAKQFFADMFIAIIIILLFTAAMLTMWIHDGIFQPLRNLSTAMQQIAEGNLDYTLPTQRKGEFGNLFRNYEDMRLRLKESIEEKAQNEQQNRELISNISHDLKTPITAIKGYVEGLMDGVANTPEKIDKYIQTIYNKANDMDKLINELSFYSHIDSNRIPYNFHRICVNDYFHDCIEEIGVELESKGIQLNYSNVVDPDTQIIADPEQLKRVINNIVGNSIKYIDKPKGIIEFRILDEIDSIRIEIEDNGKGIAAKDLSNIFERFFRTDASRNSSECGSGIGLSIVKKIIEDHGGYIWATSKENEGTCLHFVIRKYREVEAYE